MVPQNLKVPFSILLIIVVVRVSVVTSLEVSTKGTSYPNIPTPPVDACLLVIVPPNAESLQTLQLSPPNSESVYHVVIINGPAQIRNKSLSATTYLQLRPSTPFCQVYILLGPRDLWVAESILVGRIGGNPMAVVILLISNQKFISTIFVYSNYVPLYGIFSYDATIYLILSPENSIPSKILRFCFPGTTSFLQVENNIYYQHPCNPHMRNAFHGISVVTLDICDWGSTKNLCQYIFNLTTLSSRHLNFSWKQSGTTVSPAFIRTGSYLKLEQTPQTAVIVDDSKNIHPFYCEIPVQLGSYWTRWLHPFDGFTWICTLACCAVVTVILKLQAATNPWSQQVTIMMQIIFRQDIFDPNKFVIIAVVTFFYVTLLYEGTVSSYVVAPLETKAYPTLTSILDAGYRFYFPTNASQITENGVDFPEFYHGFKRAHELGRFNKKGLYPGHGYDWRDLFKHNSSLKLMADVAMDEAPMVALTMQDLFCNLVPEEFFRRIFFWQVVGKHYKKLERFLLIETRDFGFHELFKRRRDLEIVKWRLNHYREEAEQRMSYINLGNGLYTLFAICGALLIFGGIALAFEILRNISLYGLWNVVRGKCGLGWMEVYNIL